MYEHTTTIDGYKTKAIPPVLRTSNKTTLIIGPAEFALTADEIEDLIYILQRSMSDMERF